MPAKKRNSLNYEKLKSLRLAAKYTQVQLAELIGVHEIDISRYERGLVEPSLSVANSLADALGVTLNDLIKNKE